MTTVIATRQPVPWTPQRISFSRADGLPKYLAIARALTAAITERQLSPGDPLPSQKDLAASFGVTIMTVRQAIKLLTERGLLHSEHGKGTFVRSQPHRLPMGPLASFAAQIEATGRQLNTEVLGFNPIEISPLQQQRMALPAPQAFELLRLRRVDGVPLILQSSLLPLRIARRLDPRDFTTTSLYTLLEMTLDIRVARATETVQATTLDRESATLLDRAEGDAALLSTRLTFSDEGRAVVDDRALAVGDAVVVSAERDASEPGVNLVLTDDAPAPMDNSLPFARGGRS